MKGSCPNGISAPTAAMGGLATIFRARAAVARFEPPAALVEAARRDGGFVNYTAQIEDLELETIAAFNKRFPFVKVEIMHLLGGQLIERIRAEIAANKLVADLIDHSEPSLLLAIESAFRPYEPPNAADYIPAAVASRRIWPRLTAGTCIAWNSEIIKDKPKGWWDLTTGRYTGQLGTPSGYTGGSTWVWVMFQRKVLGEDYWAKHAAAKPRVYPTNAATADADPRSRPPHSAEKIARGHSRPGSKTCRNCSSPTVTSPIGCAIPGWGNGRRRSGCGSRVTLAHWPW